MSFLIAQPHSLVDAASNLEALGTAIRDATAASAAPTTKLMKMAADEVSAAVVAVFSEHAQLYQELSNQAAGFHDEFVRSLSAAAGAYATAEAANAALTHQALSTASTPAMSTVALVMGPSGMPIPLTSYLSSVNNLYIQFLHSGAITQALAIPAELYGDTGIHTITLDESVSQGVTILDSAIKQQIAAGNNVVVFGYSQSATVASMELGKLAALPAALRPATDQLSFVLVGDPNNPNGGVSERFSGLTLSTLGLSFSGATPDNAYPTTIYTREYDGYADFPRYPINLISNLNALMGVYYEHGSYADLTATGVYSAPPTAADLASAIHLPTQGPTLTDYYLIPSNHLPLLQPLRALPVVGNPLADLIEPDMRVIVNLGYGDPAYGYSTGPANVPTPFGLFPHVEPSTILADLVTGAQQGVGQFSSDLRSSLSSLSPSHLSSGTTFDPVAAISSVTTSAVDAINHVDVASLFSGSSLQSIAHGAIEHLRTANTAIANAVSTIASNQAALLLPTADIALAIGVTLPSYDVNLFLGGIQTALDGNAYGLVEAIGYPVAANMGLVPLALLLEAESLYYYGVLGDAAAISTLVAAL